MSDTPMVSDRLVPREPSWFERWLGVLGRSKLESVGLFIAFAAIFLLAFGPYLAPHNPYRVDFAAALKPPSLSHPFGTDEAGRDVLSRVMYGARLTLFAVTMVILFATVVGTT